MIEVWQNKQTEAPSLQVGSLTLDLPQSPTEAQDELFRLVMNHPEAAAAGAVRAPLSPEIARAVALVVQEELQRHTVKKKMPHFVQVELDRA